MFNSTTRKSTLRASRVRRALPVAATLALLLAGAQSAPAAVVVRSVDAMLNAQNFEAFDLDLDLDGTNDFTFNASILPGLLGFDTIDTPFASSNAFVIDNSTFDGFPTVSLLMSGAIVSSASLFSSLGDQGNLYYNISNITGEPPSGNFAGQTGFVGLRLDQGGDARYGYAQITVNAFDAPVNPLGLTIGSVGFNDTPGQAIVIGGAPTAVSEPGSLALFAAGGFGFLATRRRRRKPAAA